MGGTGCSSATPAAEGVPHGGMGGARTDGGHSMTGPIYEKIIAITEKEMLPHQLSKAFVTASHTVSNFISEMDSPLRADTRP